MNKGLIATIFLNVFVLTSAAYAADSGDLPTYLNNIPIAKNSCPPQDGEYAWQTPSYQVASTFSVVMQDLLRNDIAQAKADAQEIGDGYRLVSYSYDGKIYYILRQFNTHNGGATVVYQPNATYNVVIEAPHPVFDRYTREEAVAAFLKIPAKWLIISGAYRHAACNSLNCQGQHGNNTSWADAAHNIKNLFFIAHNAITQFYKTSQPLVIQIHGFSGDDGIPEIRRHCYAGLVKKGTGGNFIQISNGYAIYLTPPGADSRPYNFADNLYQAFDDGEIHACFYNHATWNRNSDLTTLCKPYDKVYGIGRCPYSNYDALAGWNVQAYVSNRPSLFSQLNRTTYSNKNTTICKADYNFPDYKTRYFNFYHIEQSNEIRFSQTLREKFVNSLATAVQQYYEKK